MYHQLVVCDIRALRTVSVLWHFNRSVSFIWCFCLRWLTKQLVKCFSKIHSQLNIALTSLVNTLDIITDIMSMFRAAFHSRSIIDVLSVVSIPIIILGRTRLRISQKISLGVFLCLSAAMIAIAGARFSVLHNNNLVWTYLWQYIEACVAFIMASLQTFRTLFFNAGTRIFKQQKFKEHLPSNTRRISPNMEPFNMAAWERGEDEKNELPKIPSATFSGIRNFIDRNHRSPGYTRKMNSEEDWL